MLERDVVAYLKKRVKDLGGHCRKVHWEGRAGAPDWLIWFTGVSVFVETKAPGQKPRPIQLIEHEKMRRGGMHVFVCDSRESVDLLLEKTLGGK